MGHIDPYQIEDFKPKVTTFTHKESFLPFYILFWDLEINVSMCITNTFQIKIYPKYWNLSFFWYVMLFGSLGYRLILNLSLMFRMLTRETFGTNTYGTKKKEAEKGQREKSS